MEAEEKEGKTKKAGKADKAIGCCFCCFGIIFIVGVILAFFSGRPGMALAYWTILCGFLFLILFGIPITILKGVEWFKRKSKEGK